MVDSDTGLFCYFVDSFMVYSAFAGLIGYVISRDDEEFERKFKEQERVKKERELKKEV